MINYYSANNIFIAIALIFIICISIYYLGSKAINKLPSENFRERLLQAVQYSGFIIPLLFMSLIFFQSLPYLSAPDEWSTSKINDLRHYQNIESLKIAHFSFYYSALLWALTSLKLFKKALKA